MATRKQTPDVLSEILGGEPSPSATAPAPTPRAAPKPDPAPESKPAPKRGSPGRQTTRRSRVKPVRWEYMEVVFRDYGGYRPRYVNGDEQREWKQAPPIHEYLNLVGEEGWELVGVGGRHNDQMPAYFKRGKK